LVERGASVVVAARDASSLTAACQRLGNSASAATCDVLQDDDVQSLTTAAVERLGGIDVWVNAAGRSSRGAVLETSLEDFRAAWELNFLATVRCSAAAAPHLIESSGHLVNIGSLASKFAPRWLGAYPTSKFPLAAYCQQLRLEEGDKGLHVLLVCPGPLTRDDGGNRYDAQTDGLPEAAGKPGGGAKVRTLDPHQVAEKILRACERRTPELILPAKARLLAVISQWWPAWGDRLLRRSSS
jgi:short-subunit dehydrogenase